MGRRSPPVPSRWTRADGAQPILRSSRPFELRPAERRGLLRLLPGTKRRAEALNGALSAGLHKRELRPRKVLSAQLGAAAAAAARQSPPPDDGYASQSEGDSACGCGDPSRSMRPRRVSSEDPGALVIEPTGPHTHTVVLLHGMYTAPEDSDTMMELPQSVTRVGLPGCKYVFPRAPRRTISWPTGPEANVASWYNYYTRRDGEHQHDVLNEAHLASQTRRIHSILDREIELLGGDAQRVMLGGCSQGGTVALHATINFNRPLGALICMRSCLIDSVTVPKGRRSPAASTPVFVFAAALDRVYAPWLQYRGFEMLRNSGFHVEWHVERGLTHWDQSRTEKRVVASWVARAARQREMRERERSASPELILEQEYLDYW